MNMRGWLNQNSALTTVAAVVLLICALGFAVYHLTGSSTGVSSINAMYYYDVVGGTLFGGPMVDILPPIDGPNGPITHDDKSRQAGFKAYIFACGGCSSDLGGKTSQEVEAAGAKIGYLEYYTEKSKNVFREFMENRENDPEKYMDLNRVWLDIDKGKRIAVTPEQAGEFPKLYKAHSGKAQKIMKVAMKLCPDGTLPLTCMPDQ